MKKSETTNCPRCSGKGWEKNGRMTLYYASGRMRQTLNSVSQDPDGMEELSVFRKWTPAPYLGRRSIDAEQAKIDANDYLTRKTMEPCSLCKGKKRLKKDVVIIMKLRGEV